jgi:hypothetical protein
MEARPRPLNTPVRIPVRASPGGEPEAIGLPGPRGHPQRGWRAVPVAQVMERWRIDDGWWGTNPVSRLYYRLALNDGRLVTVYRDLRDETWWAQQP